MNIKARTLALLRKLHPDFRRQSIFHVTAVYTLDGGWEVRNIVFRNTPGISDRLRAIEQEPGFSGWHKSPWTGRCDPPKVPAVFSGS